jgi:hypothetical protein
MSSVVFGWMRQAVARAGPSALANPVDMMLWAHILLALRHEKA